MSDLSWLNPTPHAIAVYASRPLPPVATQHSLPSGRYSLLGPDFHRLDRTSLRLAHSFDHLVGKREHLVWNCQAQRLGGLEVDHQLKFGGLFDWQVGRLGALQYFVHVRGRAPIEVGIVHPVCHQYSCIYEFLGCINYGQSMPCREVDGKLQICLGWGAVLY